MILKPGRIYRMSATLLNTIVRDAKVAFVVAKHDGQLEAAEVVQIAVMISKRVHALENLSLAEKDALVMLCLKKGLSAANGLQGLSALAEAGPEGMAAAEHQVLAAGVAAAKSLQDAVPQLFAPVKNSLQACLPCFAQCAAVAAVLDPKDAALIQEALQCVQAAAGAKDLSGNVIVVPTNVASTL